MFEIKPWRPLRDLSILRKEMDTLWDDFFGGKESVLPAMEAWTPAIDVSETKDAIIVKAEIPGMEAKDIDISMSGDLLTVKGEKRQKTEDKGENYHRVETRYGAFARTIRLPVAVNADKIEARYDKGVLNVTLPKKEKAQVKQIPVKTG